jgi:hypothetical protein
MLADAAATAPREGLRASTSLPPGCVAIAADGFLAGPQSSHRPLLPLASWDVRARTRARVPACVHVCERVRCTDYGMHACGRPSSQGIQPSSAASPLMDPQPVERCRHLATRPRPTGPRASSRSLFSSRSLPRTPRRARPPDMAGRKLLEKGLLRKNTSAPRASRLGTPSPPTLLRKRRASPPAAVAHRAVLRRRHTRSATTPPRGPPCRAPALRRNLRRRPASAPCHTCHRACPPLGPTLGHPLASRRPRHAS